MRTQVLIAGAGPTGLATAVALRRHGVDVHVVDAAPGPATTSRALGLVPRGADVLARLGALGELPVHALATSRATIREGERVLFRWKFGTGTGERALFISQADIERRLRDRLAELGGSVAWDSRLTAVLPDDAGITATVGGAEIRADWLAGCDGAHSTVRKVAGIGFPGAPVIERLLLTDIRAGLPFDREGSSTWLHPEGAVIVIPMPGGAWRLFTQPPAELAEDAGGEVLAESALAVLAARTGVDTGGAEVLWASRFRIHRRLADTYRAGRVLLAGDAAHIHSPIGAQGMNTGLGDAENLAFKLALVARGVAGERLLDTYEAERRPVARAVLERTTSVTELMLAPTVGRRLLRDLVLRPVLSLPVVQRRLWHAASQMGVTYRDGPLGGDGRGPRPGDRVAEAGLDGVWTVLAADAGEGEPYRAVARALFGDIPVAVRVSAGLPDVRFVRPDGHLLWRGTDVHVLRGRLVRLLADS